MWVPEEFLNSFTTWNDLFHSMFLLFYSFRMFSGAPKSSPIPVCPEWGAEHRELDWHLGLNQLI